MKLLHVIPSLNPAGGGPIEGLKQLARAEMSLGHVVEVAVFDESCAPWLRKLPFPVHSMGPHISGYWYVSRFVPWLKAHVEDYDAVIVEGLWLYHGFATWRVLRNSKTPYFVFTHGMLDPWFKRTYPLKHIKKWLYWPWAEYRLLRDAKAVLFTCEEERIVSRQSFWLYKCNEKVVGYGTVAPPGNTELQREIFFVQYPDLRGKRLFLFLSRIHEKKGCDLLIEAFAQIVDRHPALHLVMAGPDQTGWQKDLVALSEELGVADRITWTGMISGDLKWGAYHASEAFVLPSHQENFGVVVAEALACGLPVLISNKVNIWREICDDGAGLVENDDLIGAVHLFETWLSMEPGKSNLMKENALRCYRSRFEIGKTAQILCDVIGKHIINANS